MAPLFSKEIFALPGLKSVLLHRGDKPARRNEVKEGRGGMREFPISNFQRGFRGFGLLSLRKVSERRGEEEISNFQFLISKED
jgi:hypothetical protein